MTWRAIWVLERIGNEDARAILKELVDRRPADPAAQEAKAALERLDRKYSIGPQRPATDAPEPANVNTNLPLALQILQDFLRPL